MSGTELKELVHSAEKVHGNVISPEFSRVGSHELQVGASESLEPPPYNPELIQSVEVKNIEPRKRPSGQSEHDKSDYSAYPDPPPDKFSLVYWAFILQGLAGLMPWNACLVVQYSFFAVGHKLSTDYVKYNSPAGKEAVMSQAESFPNMMNIFAMAFNLSLCLTNTFARFGKNSLTRRVVGALIIIISGLTLLMSMAAVDTSGNAVAYMAVTLIVFIFMNGALGLYQNVIFGLVAVLPFKYMGAVIIGNNASGIFCSIVSILSKLGDDVRVSTILLFLAVILVSVLAIDTYFALPLLQYYGHFEAIRVAEDARAGPPKEVTTLESIVEMLKTCTFVGKIIYRNLLDIFFTFFISLLVYPGLFTTVKPRPDEEFFLAIDYRGLTDVSKFYLDFAIFLNFNVFTVLGNYLTNWIQKPGPQYLWVLVYLRFFILVLVPMLNTQPCTRALGVWFYSGWWPLLLCSIHSFSHGYCSSLSMMYAPKQIEVQYQGFAGMLAGLTLIFAIVCGFACTPVVKILINLGTSDGSHCGIVIGNNPDYFNCDCNGTLGI